MWKRDGIGIISLQYFKFLKEPKFGKFSVLPKLYKRLRVVPGRRLTISNSGFYTQNTSRFRFSTIATKVKSCIKDTNDFLGKRLDLPEIPNGIILCTVDVVELYPLNPSEEGLHSLKEAVDKTVPTVSLTTSLNLIVGSEHRKKVPLRELNLLSLICSWLL